MRTQLEAAIKSLESWFISKEFGRIALNAGFELTVRDRLLENLQLEFQRTNPEHSIVSEFSKHGLGRHLRADMALLEGSLCGDEFKCEGIFEIKTNFTAQSFNIIKKRLADDWSKWNEWTNANKKLCLIYIVTEIKHDESSNNFPKYKQKPTKIEKIEDYFIRFSEENGGHYNKINKFNASSSYPGCGVFNITTNFLVIEN